ncbi:MAG TPA: hypothetical protein VJN43_08685 [Bryobacteraceae bacterium]|nr:hypothetical protein [Bryobacteraceae bacterium]
MKFTVISRTLLIALVGSTFAQLPDDLKRRFDDAERRIVRLPPTAFPELPRNLVQELQRRGCTIPQTPYTKRPQNVIKGEFARPGEIDWAVLCSVNQTTWLFSLWSGPHYLSSILVFWNSSGDHPSEIAPKEDRNYLQGITANEIGFYRIIGTAGREFIIRHNDSAYSAPPPYKRLDVRIDHQGIDDSFAEKGSETWYFHDGKWGKLMGAD